jgi:hypothetical protein
VEARENVRQQAGHDALDDPQADLAAPEPAQVVDPGAGAVEVAKNAVAVPRQHLAGHRELDAHLRALEQHCIDLVLELGDLPADRRRRDMQAVRGLADRAEFGDFVEIAQREETHGLLSWAMQGAHCAARRPRRRGGEVSPRVVLANAGTPINAPPYAARSP